MSTSKSIKMVCPYCEAKWRESVKEGVQFIFCPDDEVENACGERFVIDVSFRVEYKSFKLVENE